MAEEKKRLTLTVTSEQEKEVKRIFHLHQWIYDGGK
jgi:hypothetical protein